MDRAPHSASRRGPIHAIRGELQVRRGDGERGPICTEESPVKPQPLRCFIRLPTGTYLRFDRGATTALVETSRNDLPHDHPTGTWASPIPVS